MKKKSAMNNSPSEKGIPVAFAAIDPYLETVIPTPVETPNRSKEWIMWGKDNLYPDYLLDLYRNVATLRTIINGNVDFIAGDDITIAPLNDSWDPGRMNVQGDSIRDQVRDLGRSVEIYGGFAMQVIRDTQGRPAEIYVLDPRHLRMNKEGDVFYYCEDWAKRGSKGVNVYPAFLPDLADMWPELSDEQRDRHASSIVYVRAVKDQVYPAPLYAAAVRSCEIERCIDDYHLTSINNGFASSMIVNFNNGQPNDQQKKEIERGINEKFAGPANAGRVLISWNKNKDSATTFEVPKLEDFGEKYKTLAERSRQQIYCAFRAIPALFGLVSESTGFNTQEFEQSFRVYSRTQIRPVQRLIVEAYERIYGAAGIMTIKPFTLDGIDNNIQ